MKTYLTFLVLISVVLIISCDSNTDPKPNEESGLIVWTRHVIDDDIRLGVSVDTIDMDSDGDLDFLVTAFLDNELIWYENPSWNKNVIADDLNGITFAYCTDLDMNGTLDIVASNHFDQSILSYFKEGDQWIKDVIIPNADHSDLFQFGDINLDNRPDIVTAGDAVNGGDVVWYENQHPNWIAHTIEDGSGRYPGTSTLDVDLDGRLDVVATMNAVGKLVWFRNPSEGDTWVKNYIDQDLPNLWGGPNFGDLDGDSDVDIITTTGGPYFTGSSVLWYENNHPDWTKHIIDENLDGATWPLINDIDEDGVMDVIVTGYRSNSIVWYEYDQGYWNKHIIADDLVGPRLFIIIDVNEDGLKDIVVAGEHEVVWYEQAVE